METSFVEVMGADAEYRVESKADVVHNKVMSHCV
jgi:hypothetical protein